MRIPRWIRISLLLVLAILLLIALGIGSVWLYFHPSYQRTNDSGHDQPTGFNRLAQAPAPTGPNQIWGSDLTCVAAEVRNRSSSRG